MKFSQKTLDILNNFSNINSSLTFKKGNRQSTMSLDKTILAEAVLDVEIPQEFSIYDLPSFLRNVKLLENPELVFNDTHVVLTGNNIEVEYYYCMPNLIVSPPDKQLDITGATTSFELDQNQLLNIIKLATINTLTHVKFTYDTKTDNFVASAMDQKGAQQNRGRILIKKQEGDLFNANDENLFKSEKLLKLMPVSYRISVIANKYAKFENNFVSYFIACETNNQD